MKRLLAVLLAVALLCGLGILAAGAEDPVFQAGYAKVDITPTEEGLPLCGYGSVDRIFTAKESDLFVTAIAMTDKYGTTALMISVDTHNTSQLWSNEAKSAIVEALADEGVDVLYDRIYISATTTLSAPEIIYSGTDPDVAVKVDTYKTQVINACVQAAQEACADRVPVTMYHNDMDASEGIVHLKAEAEITVQDGDPETRLNYNTHYNVVSKTDENEKYVAGSGVGPTGYLNDSNYTVTEVAQPDDTMGLLLLDPVDDTKAPIVLANWSAKANITSSGVNMYGVLNDTVLSSDYVGFFRDKMAESNYRTAFFQGTSGNVYAFPLVATQRNPDVMEEYKYTEDVEGVPTEKTVNTITPRRYGEKLAELAIHGLTHEEGENHLHAADMDAPINNLKFTMAVKPDVSTAAQVELVNVLKTTDAPTQTEGEIDPSVAVYANAYEYLVDQWDTAKPQVVQLLTDAGKTELADSLNALLKPLQLTGIAARMTHSVNTNRTDFATDAVHCDATVLQLGKMTFVMAPADLYDHYSKAGTTNDWSHVGAHFVLGNTNGASGSLPNTASFHYNEGSDTYVTGTSDSLSSYFPEGAGETLMETYINVKKTMSAKNADEEGYDSENAIRLQCECAGQAEGKPGHTCEPKEFRPWYDPDSLPASGYYYLMDDVKLLRESRNTSGELCIDLNGHTITRVVLREVVLDQTGTEVPTNHYYMNTRLFALENDARLTITDFVGGGKLTRDISDLDAYNEDEQKKIHNYGLLVALIDGNDSEFILYKGTLDATGQYSGGGACVANMSNKKDEQGEIVYQATFTMYDGELLGGVSDRGAAVYANGNNEFYGGTITGGEVKDTAGDEDENADKNGIVNVVGGGKLLLAGDTTISGGKRGDDDCNMVIKDSNSLTVAEDYTGTVGVTVPAEDPNGAIIGWLENVPEATFDNFTVDNYDNYEVTLCNSQAVTIAEIRTYCVCGGKAEGKHDHVCEDIQWKPWPIAYNGYLPDSSLGGNYYLLTDITLKEQKSVLAPLHLDMNGHNIVHVVNPGEKTLQQLNNSGTRVFYVGVGGSLTLTDSTQNPGTVSRDLSKLSEEQKEGIANYGLIILINQEAGGDCILFDGILDATDQVSGGGACVANLTKDVPFRMYGGKLLGGRAYTGGCVYSSGPVELHGGVITGGKATGANGVGGVAIITLDANPAQGRLEKHIGSLSICGNVQVTGNVDQNDRPSNIRVTPGYKNFKIVGNFTGNIGVLLNQTPEHNMPVAKGESAAITGDGVITGENYGDYYSLKIENDYLVVQMAAAKIGDTYYDTLQEAFTAYAGGNTVITLQRPVDEDSLEITQNTFLDLSGWDVTANTGFTTNGNQLFVLDTETDDYTINAGKEHYAYNEVEKDYLKTLGNGYGIMQGDIAEAAVSAGEGYNVVLAGSEKPIDLYLKIREAGKGTSFHRLNLRFAGITLRPDSMKDGTYWPGLYYNSHFGGDEVIKANIKSFGVGMSAYEDEPMYTRDNSYTEVPANEWLVGIDQDGNSNNLRNGTILTGIMKTSYNSVFNRRNSTRAIRGQNYVILQSDERIVGPEISYSLKDVFEGNGIVGIDDLWNSQSVDSQTDVKTLYQKFSLIMKNWNIPNIKAAVSK